MPKTAFLLTWLACAVGVFLLTSMPAFAQREPLRKPSVFSCADGRSVMAATRGAACIRHGGIAKANATTTHRGPVKRDTGSKFCDATIASSGDGTGILRCGESTCKSEYPAGQSSSFECSRDKCPVTSGTTYAASCEDKKFNSGCSVSYKDVTECKAP
jgi:hypothetical protein